MFDEINIDDLANMEEGIGDFKPATPEAKKEEKKTEKTDTNQEEITEDPDAIDLEDLVDLGESEEDDEDNPGEENKEKKKKTSDKSTEQISSSQETFTFLASALAESGVFSSLDEEEIKEIDDYDKLADAIAKQIKTNELADLNDEQKKYIEALRTGVPHVSYEKAQGLLDQYKNIDDDKIEKEPRLQFELIKRSYIAEGVSSEKAIKLANIAVNSDEAATEAVEAKKALIEHEQNKLKTLLEEAKTAKEEDAKKLEEELSSLKSKINEASEIIPGIKINAQTRDKIYKSITSPVKVEGEQIFNDVLEAYKNPDYKMKLHALHVITNGFKDFSKFTKTSTSSAVKAFEEKLATGNVMKVGRLPNNTNNTDGSTSKDIAKALKEFKF